MASENKNHPRAHPVENILNGEGFDESSEGRHEATKRLVSTFDGLTSAILAIC